MNNIEPTKGGRLAMVCLWITFSALTWPGFFASTYAATKSYKTCRQVMSMSLLFSAFPPTWFVAPFATGFYEDGFKVSCKKPEPNKCFTEEGC